MIERLSEAIGAALVGNDFSPIPSMIENFISQQKKCDSSQPEIYNPLILTLELSKSGRTVSSSEPVTASSDCSRIRSALCLC